MSLRALLVEDEPLAARRLADLLARQPDPVHILGTAESVAQAVQLLEAGPAPDVLFLDIHLADGLSFEIFELTPVRCPVIFTTAYDQYALQAFKVNSVDYLLKPIDEAELAAALAKLRQQLPAATAPSAAPDFDPALLAQLMQQMQQTLPDLRAAPAASYKTQFVVRVGEHLKVVPLDQVAYFFSLEKATFLQTIEGRKFVVDSPWTSSKRCSTRAASSASTAPTWPSSRPSRTSFYTNSRLQTVLKPVAPDAQVLVSREKVNTFKSWLDR